MTAPDWSALPADLVNHVADCLLATNDVDYYMDLRAVCRNWRAATTDPKSCSLCDPLFRPSRWVMLPEGDHFNDDEIVLFANTSTGRFVRKRLPLIRNYHLITSITGGFLVLADKKDPHTASVLNPFTGSLIRFKAPVLPSSPADLLTGVHLTADVVGELPTLVLATCRSSHGSVRQFTFYLADPDSEQFCAKKIGDHVKLSYPLRLSLLRTRFVVAELAAGEMVLIHYRRGIGFLLYRMDAARRATGRIDSIGSRALFLGRRRSLSIDAVKFPSIKSNCIYYSHRRIERSRSRVSIYVYDLAHRTPERIAEDVSEPCTVIQLLSNYTIHDPLYDPIWDGLLETCANLQI